MLISEEVHAHYGLSHVLHGVNLEVKEGEVLGLFGRNGVGKSTFLKTIVGLLPPSDGVITFKGMSINGKKPEEISRRGIAYVPEDRRIFSGLTVDENIKLGLRCIPSREKRSKMLSDIYEKFPVLLERRNQLGTTLSGGEQQILAIARGVALDPKLLLIDEPTEGLAPKIVDIIFQSVSNLAKEGRAIILVEQNVIRALERVNKFCCMERGQITFEGVSGNPGDKEKLLEHITFEKTH